MLLVIGPEHAARLPAAHSLPSRSAVVVRCDTFRAISWQPGSGPDGPARAAQELITVLNAMASMT